MEKLYLYIGLLRELELLTIKQIKHLYVHFPFCNSKCYYCGFYSITNFSDDLLNKYITALENELLSYSKKYDLTRLETVYIGGGNPSIKPQYLIQIDQIIAIFCGFNYIKEYTIECNPNNISLEFISYLSKTSCNRLSLGIQSFTDKAVVFCNRNQTKDIVLKSLSLVNSLNLKLSIDIINYLPYSETEIELKELEDVLSKFNNIKHISIYDLSIDKGSFFYEHKNIKLDDETSFYYEEGLSKLLKSFNFNRYEISNYAQKGYESIHNKAYWQYKDYLGIGPGAHSTIGEIRIENNQDIHKYVLSAEYFNMYTLSYKEQIEEYILMGFRLISNGFSIDKFNKKFKNNFYKIFKNTIYKYNDLKYVYINKNIIYLNDMGINYLNQILIDLFMELDQI